jgi:hypothetical protein
MSMFIPTEIKGVRGDGGRWVGGEGASLIYKRKAKKT